MAYHETKINGPMRQCTIVTVVRVPEDIARHDEKVNKFNEENTVFYNQANSHDKGEEKGIGIRLVTTCLYANGAKK
jgi:hypothetical protein